ncbi:hypothetical protein BC938DRAFT_480784 [Jimgerdemannia flammicorona]|uniref:Major facilitator superfamily (MFS) profile domain-containing protein n=1 Tax=Jimgerdemannia flammicorona TaxID=994334 RepID=A0A433QIE9_9FUNG|nr:hypothetical protein BC938DRAFT_480784 [Jimgerdemannia flammicorona]
MSPQQNNNVVKLQPRRHRHESTVVELSSIGSTDKELVIEESAKLAENRRSMKEIILCSWDFRWCRTGQHLRIHGHTSHRPRLQLTGPSVMGGNHLLGHLRELPGDLEQVLRHGWPPRSPLWWPALCGASVSIQMPIVGRAVQGIGGAALFAMVNVVLADVLPLRGVIRGDSATTSGLRFLPATIVSTVVSLSASFLISYTSRYRPTI